MKPKLKTPFNVTFIGTGGVMPHRKRLFPFMIVNLKQKILFLDFGEGSQRAMLKLKLSLIIPDFIFISHYHLDHFHGLLPYLKTLEMMGITKKIKIFLPEVQERELFENQLLKLVLNIELKIGNDSYQEEGVSFLFFKTKHTRDSRGVLIKIAERRTYLPEIIRKLKGPALRQLKDKKKIVIDNFEYNYETSSEVLEKEHSLVYTSDTSPLSLPISEYIIHECTYLEGEEKTALKKRHSCLTDILLKLKDYKKIFLVHLHPKYNIYPSLPVSWKWPLPYEFADLNEDT